MRREVRLTREPINEADLLARRCGSNEMGGVVYFAGRVRGIENEARIRALEYEAFERMAVHQLQLLCDQVEKRWPIESVRLVHRLGTVPAGETSLWIEVVAPHRGEAFAACQWIIDEMKRVVPIWKKPVV